MSDTHSVIDLFAGAGGLSLGAVRAGFDLKLAVENDVHANSTHKLNFPNCSHLNRNIATITPSEILTEIKLQKGELTGIIGGPPCQGFSTMGKQDKTDTRNELFYHFFRLVKEISPSFFVAENVPGIMNEKYNDLREKAFAQISSEYILLNPITVKASDYGVPTIRKRVFFIGYKKDKFPKPLNISDFSPPQDAESITVRDALAGLPENISSEWLSEEDGWQTLEKKNGSVFMQKITGLIPNGIGNETLLKKYLEENKVSGCQGTRHTPELIERYSKLEYGKQDKISKASRLNPTGFCPTLRAGTGSDKGSYQAVRPIHFNQPRVITPREAARLQGFPDWFVFHPTKWHSFRQIGNSVSPIVAEYLLKQILVSLKPLN